MFKNVGKEIKNELKAQIVLGTIPYILAAILLSATFYSTDEGLAIFLGIMIVPIVGAIGYYINRMKAAYRYAFAELVETVSKINILLANQAVNQWQCPECHGLNNDSFNYCQSCGCKKP